MYLIVGLEQGVYREEIYRACQTPTSAENRPFRPTEMFLKYSNFQVFLYIMDKKTIQKVNFLYIVGTKQLYDTKNFNIKVRNMQIFTLYLFWNQKGCLFGFQSKLKLSGAPFQSPRNEGRGIFIYLHQIPLPLSSKAHIICIRP